MAHTEYIWHHETLAQYGISESSLPKTRRSDPSLYEKALRSEWNRWCEDTHLAEDFDEWKKRFGL